MEDLPSVGVATAFLRRDLARVRLLGASAVAHSPATPVVAVVVDDAGRAVDGAGEAFELHHVEDLLEPGVLARALAADDPAPLLEAAEAALAALLADRGHAVVRLPPGAVVEAPLDPSIPAAGWRVPVDDDAHLRRLHEHGHHVLAGLTPRVGLRALDGYVGAVVAAAHDRFRAGLAPGAPDDPAAFRAWLRAPDPRAAGAGKGVSRLLLDLWSVRPDLQAQYPDLDGDDGPLLVAWAWEWGAALDGVPLDLLPPRPPPEALARPLDSPPPLVGTGRSVNVIGLLERELGLGQAARHLVAALDAVRVPVLPIEARSVAAPARPGAAGSALPARFAVFPVNLVCLNGEQLTTFADAEGRDLLADRPTIAVWFWEVGAAPAHWFDRAHLLDEIWVPSTFMARAIAPTSPVPVRAVPQAVEVAAAAPLDRAALGIDPGTFTFLFVFDHASDLERKNPLGLLEAYERAFPEPDGSTTLVLKSMNAGGHPEDADRLRLAASRRPDVRLLDTALPRALLDALLAGCDCYVSLHRSEGFGLTMAEAMLHGRPVIATGYGGNVDFMDADGCWLVGHRLVPVPAGSVYAGAGEWAEPDLDEAAAAMRAVLADPAEAAARAERGRARVRDSLGPVAVGHVLRERLAPFWDRAESAGAGPPVAVDLRRAAELAAAALAGARRQAAGG